MITLGYAGEMWSLLWMILSIALFILFLTVPFNIFIIKANQEEILKLLKEKKE